MTLKRVERSTGMEGVLEAIRTAILDNSFPPGFQLKQSTIADDLNVSQGMVREALIRLVEEGLVVNHAYRGMFVCRLTEEDVNEIYQLREALEILAVESAFEKLCQPNNLEELERLHLCNLDARRNQNPNLIASTDLEFHRFIVHLSGNSRLIKAWESLVAQSNYILTRLYMIMAVPHDGNHTPWLETIKREDLIGIRKLIQRRMADSKKAVLDHWDQLDYAERGTVGL